MEINFHRTNGRVDELHDEIRLLTEVHHPEMVREIVLNALKAGQEVDYLAADVAEFGDTVEEPVERLPAMAAKDPAACRARAERYFGHLTMGEEYLRCYSEWLARGELPEGRRTEAS